MTDFTGLLYAKPSFMGGMGRALDLGGVMTDFNRSITGEQADRVAIRSSWLCVGETIRGVMDAFGRDLSETPDHG